MTRVPEIANFFSSMFFFVACAGKRRGKQPAASARRARQPAGRPESRMNPGRVSAMIALLRDLRRLADCNLTP